MRNAVIRSVAFLSVAVTWGCDSGGEGDPSASAAAESSGESPAGPGGESSAGNAAAASGGSANALTCSVDPGCAPEIVGRAPANLQVGTVRGDRLYGYGRDGFFALDVSDPTAIAITGQAALELQGIPIGLAASDALALVLGLSQVAVVDVSDPAAPRAAATWATRATDVEVLGDTAYLVGDMMPVLRVWDIADPANASQVGEVTTARWEGTTGPSNLARTGDTLVVSDGFGLVFFDVSNPRQPTEIGQTRHTTTKDVVVVGHYALVANVRTGLDVVDLSDPTAPSLVVEGCEGASPMYLGASAQTAFLFHDRSGDRAIFALDISEPAAPRLIGRAEIGQHVALGSAQGAYFVTRPTDAPMVYEVVAVRGCL